VFHDTKAVLNDAKRKGIVPFALTVDRAGHDYLKTMCEDIGYEVVADIESLPSRLPTLYRKPTEKRVRPVTDSLYMTGS
jgi:nitric oxide reductase NorD protein